MTRKQPPRQIDQLVINWHINEACNYRCDYCYAKWSDQKTTRDLVRNPEKTEALLTELWAYFAPSNDQNPLREELNWSRVRLNFAGGEPLLHVPSLLHAIQTAHSLGFDVSLITNGSKLDHQNLAAMASHLDWLGLSIDAGDPQTNRAIGRVDRRDQFLDLSVLSDAISASRALSSSMKLKINTVVSKNNYTADLEPVLEQLRPEKWKVLRVLPMVTEAGIVSDEQFAHFVAAHEQFRKIMYVEDNSDMLQTYLMIDPKGRFFQSHPKARQSGYFYSDAIQEIGAARAFRNMVLSASGFADRYR